jgi:2,3-bisphosphoglycerate-independent phosphoglycerate mutase
MKKILFLLLDGLGDVRYSQLGNKTPLEAAKTPVMDSLAFNGYCGKLTPIGFGKYVPLSDASLMTFSNFGYDVRKIKPNRGFVEAVGAGIKIKNGNLCARTNFAIVDKDWRILDMRAGRLKTEEAERMAKKINRIKFYAPFKFVATYEHRGVLVFFGSFSDKIPIPDPHLPMKKVRKSSKMLNDFMDLVYSTLKGDKANFLLIRGLGSKLPKIKKFGFTACAIGVGDKPLDHGISTLIGIKTLRFPREKEMTSAHKRAIDGAFNKFDFVFVPFKETDIPGHDGDFRRKVKEIELVDKFIGTLDLKDKLIVVTTDHRTVCKKRVHARGSVPTMISLGSSAQKRKFGERYCTDFNLPSYKLMPLIKKLD